VSEPRLTFESHEAEMASAASIGQGVAAEPVEPIAISGALTMFDQALVSGANFISVAILARACSQEEVGVYSLAWTVVLFLAAAQANIITMPYTVYCHRRSGRDLAEYGGSAVAHQLISTLAAVFCCLLMAAVLSFDVGFRGLRTTSWVLIGAVPMVLARDFTRRFAFAHLSLRAATAMDAAVSIIQVAGLVALWRFGRLSAATGFVAMGLACALGPIGWWLVGRPTIHFSRSAIWSDWRENWAFGRWALRSQLTGLAFYVLPWLLAAVHGKAETGELAACTSLVGLSNLFVMGLNNLLMPKAARAFTRQGPAALRRVLRKALLLAVVVLGGLCAAAMLLGNRLAGAVYGPQYADTGVLLSMLALAALAEALVVTGSTGLWAMDRPASSFHGDVVQMIVTLLAAAWLVFPLGALGIAAAMVVGRTVGAAVRWITLWKLTSVEQVEIVSSC